MKRTFIAVKAGPGEKLGEAIQEIRSKLRNEQIKWVDLSQAHITLSFLGDTSEQSISDVTEMLSARCAGFGDIDFELKGIGVFRSIADPKVIWAGISDGSRLSELFSVVKDGLGDLGILTEERPFRPHLTLARVRSLKNKDAVAALIEKYKELVFQSVRVSELIYFESILQQTGPLYLPLKKIRL